MEDKANGPTFKKNNNRKRIAIGTTAVIIAVVVAVVIVIVVVQSTKDKNGSSDTSQIIQNEVSEPAKFMSVTSSGLVFNQISVTVRYEGHESCTHAWTYGHVMSNTLTFEGGSKTKIQERLFETSIILTDSNITFIYLRIYCKQYSSILQFDLNALQNANVQDDIPDLTSYLFTLNLIDKEPNTDNVRVNLRMNSRVNVTDGTVDIGMYFNGLNTSVTPQTVFEEVYIPTGFANSSLRILELPLDNGVAQGNIVVASRIAQYGGILTASTRKQINNGFIRSIEQGISIYLETSRTNEVIPTGIFGLYRKPEDSDKYIIYKDSHSFNCFIMGNPVPAVEIVLTYPNGTTAEFQAITLLREQYTYHDIVNVEKRQFPDGGTFTCRASVNGQSQTREVTFEFREPRPCQPTSTLTGVMTQSNEEDVVRCTAAGDPRPELEITLYNHFGPDLTKIDTFQASRAILDDTTTSVVLTISPPNPDIHTVFCVCKQNMFTSPTRPESYQSIVLYPDRQNNETLYSELLDKLYPPFR